MDVKEISDLTREINEMVDNINSIQLFFIVRHKRRGEYEYSIHYPSLHQSLNSEIVDLIIRPFIANIQDSSLDCYDPVAKNIDSLEYIDKESVIEAVKILNKIDELHESEGFSLAGIDSRALLGYCIKCISTTDKVAYYFKKLTNTKLLEKKKLFWGLNITAGSTIEKITHQPLVIDERIDCLLYEDVFYVNNSYLFEVLFGLNEEYRRKINHILTQISQKDIIVNIEAFSIECKNAKLAQRRLIKIANSNYEAINILKANPEKMNSLIQEHNLQIDISSDGKIVYNEGDVEPVLRLIDGGLITMDVTGLKRHALKLSTPLG